MAAIVGGGFTRMIAHCFELFVGLAVGFTMGLMNSRDLMRSLIVE